MENENMPVIQEEEKAAGQKATKRMPRIGLPVSGRIHIPCKGRKDIEFTGRLLAEEEEAHKKNPKNKDRWTRLSVYEVDTTGKTRVSVAVASHLPFPGKMWNRFMWRKCAGSLEIWTRFSKIPPSKRIFMKNWGSRTLWLKPLINNVC